MAIKSQTKLNDKHTEGHNKYISVSPEIIPKYYRIAAELREQIVSNKLRVGSKLPGERDLAEKFNTTHITVRQALDCLVQERLIERIHGKGSFVRSQIKSKTIAVTFDVQVFGGAASPYFSTFARKSIAYWQREGFKCELCFVCYENPQSIERFEETLRSRMYQGVVVVSQPVADKLIKLANHLNIPTVSPYPYDSVPYYVGFDGKKFIGKAVRILAERGIKKVGIIMGKDNFGNYKGNIELFKSAVCKYEMSVQDKWICVGGYDAEFGIEAIKNIWNRKEHPEGIIITDEVIGGGVIKSTTDLKIHLGDELTIVSHFSEGTTIPAPSAVIKLITPVSKQVKLIGEILTNLIEGKNVTDTRILLKPLTEVELLSEKETTAEVIRQGV